MALIGYARASTREQNLQLQVEALQAAGCEKTYKDQASGKTARDRTNLGKMLEYIREDDIVLVTGLDRLSRTLIDLLKLIEEIKARGAHVKSVTEPFDTSTYKGRMGLRLLASIAEFERERIRERTKEGLKAARGRGRIGGRPPILNDRQRELIIRMDNDGDGLREIARTFRVAPGTIKRVLDQHKANELQNAESDD